MLYPQGRRAPELEDQVSESYGQSFWDERYTGHDAVWSGKPNPQLVAEARSLRPGSALDVGCGEGADAIWLAQLGWSVTGLDFSEVALRRGAARAADVGALVAERITWLHADVRTWRPSTTYELVSAHFMHLPSSVRTPLFARLADAVSPHGTLLLVGHDASDLHTTVQRPQDGDLYFDATAQAATLDPQTWQVVVSEARPRTATGADGQAATVHDAVLRAIRLR